MKQSLFPSAILISQAPTKLPVPFTSLVGRERELITIQQFFAHSDGRLLTLTGPGGVGKTRLALQLASDLSANFSDGVFFISLASLPNHQLLISTIAQTLGVREALERSLPENVKEFLSNKQVLLVLDNFEHILPAGPLLADLLQAAPQLRILVTSRAPLRLRGE